MNNQFVLLFSVVAVAAAVAVRGEGPTPLTVWLIFIASVAAAVYFFGVASNTFTVSVFLTPSRHGRFGGRDLR
ncbi:MAG: hypothetical protein LJE69_07885 [Thiohalocapsa sp.]|jgi:hypothetical protein|uniref:hypothetical protein n=1 Tax=Thiohalocapsa sp. TaxID=2497641 RepID=UPI0025DDA420|nr:hypothetical protein [Thiohalocapsa sp.]MCG6941155.1 hypothetical protein [Thiohalocapsa sp.]